MKFKVGDFLIGRKRSGTVHLGEVETVWHKNNTTRDFHAYDIGCPTKLCYYEDEVEKVALNNSLNKKLYPDRVPVKIKVVRDDPDRVVWQNYLVPREVAEKLIEETSHRKEQDDKN